ncbi:nucleotidyltransferase substrate binding protein [Microbulbifer elongatus]|uniref:nucleotidyltransferase substrate binding protein n=1 Tax=Microbulbifer elongatus TaxID=86173 RepID=UPI001E460E7F|nr:nucleotidyltransferase substrate binding protein [Microbulbifer elongatus]
MTLNVDHLCRTVDTLAVALEELGKVSPGSVQYDLFRNAAIKSFALSLETSGKLLRKALKAFSGSPRQVDRLVFNDVLRNAGTHGLLSIGEVERWLEYRADRNTTAQDYGEQFANETLVLLPRYVEDARALAKVLSEMTDGTQA